MIFDKNFAVVGKSSNNIVCTYTFENSQAAKVIEDKVNSFFC